MINDNHSTKQEYKEKFAKKHCHGDVQEAEKSYMVHLACADLKDTRRTTWGAYKKKLFEAFTEVR